MTLCPTFLSLSPYRLVLLAHGKPLQIAGFFNKPGIAKIPLLAGLKGLCLLSRPHQGEDLSLSDAFARKEAE